MRYCPKSHLETAKKNISIIAQIASQFSRFKDNVDQWDAISRLPLIMGNYSSAEFSHPYILGCQNGAATYSSANHTYHDITMVLMATEIQTVTSAIRSIQRRDDLVPHDQVADYLLKEISWNFGSLKNKAFECILADEYDDDGKTDIANYPYLIPELDFKDNWHLDKLIRAQQIIPISKATHVMLMLADPERPYITETLNNAVAIEMMCKEHIYAHRDELEAKQLPKLGEVEAFTYFGNKNVIVRRDDLVLISKEWADSGDDLTISDDKHVDYIHGTPSGKILAYKCDTGHYVPIVVRDPFEPKNEFEKQLKERLSDSYEMFSLCGDEFFSNFTKFVDRLVELREIQKNID